MKIFLPAVFVLLLCGGCTRGYYTNEPAEPDTFTRQARVEEFGQILKSAKAGDPIAVVLYDGTRMAGSFFSCTEGLLTIRVGDTFRDMELAEVRSLSFRSASKQLKTALYVLIGITMAFIVFEFSKK